MSEKKLDSTIKVIPFCGKSVYRPVCSERLLACARHKDHKSILFGSILIPLDNNDLTQNSSDNALTVGQKKEKERLRDQNEKAYKDFILSVNGDSKVCRVVFKLVRGAKTKRLADGDAYEAVKVLSGNFKEKTTPSCLLLKEKILNLRLKIKLDPKSHLNNRRFSFTVQSSR